MKKIMTVIVAIMTMVSIMVPVAVSAKSYCEYDAAISFYTKYFEDNACCYSMRDLHMLAEIMADDYEGDVVNAIKYTDTTYGKYQHQLTVLFGSEDEEGVFTYRTIVIGWSDTAYGTSACLIDVDDTKHQVNMATIFKAYEIGYIE